MVLKYIMHADKSAKFPHELFLTSTLTSFDTS